MKKIAKGLFVIASVLLAVYFTIVLLSERSEARRLEKTKKNLEANNMIFITWLFKYIKGGDVFEYFEANGIKSIAVYGLGNIGTLFVDALRRYPGIEVKYIIDKTVRGSYKNVEIIPIEKVGEREQVDAIIVTPHYAFNVIENDLKPHTDAKIISFLEVLSA